MLIQDYKYCIGIMSQEQPVVEYEWLILSCYCAVVPSVVSDDVRINVQHALVVSFAMPSCYLCVMTLAIGLWASIMLPSSSSSSR